MIETDVSCIIVCVFELLPPPTEQSITHLDWQSF